MRGADVLQHVVGIPRLNADLAGWVGLGQIARRVTGASDGRRIYQVCRRLESADLIEIRRHAGQTDLRATGRGREVDGILARITHARGGTFAPWSHSGISVSETHALQRRAGS